jgi:hypothetical protein
MLCNNYFIDPLHRVHSSELIFTANCCRRRFLDRAAFFKEPAMVRISLHKGSFSNTVAKTAIHESFDFLAAGEISMPCIRLPEQSSSYPRLIKKE